MTGAPGRRLVVLAIVWLALPAGWLGLRAAAGEGGVPRGAGVTTPTAAVDRFDVRRAMATVRLQLAAGQRPAGSAALRAVAEQLRRRLPQGHFENLPDHPGLRNIVGELPGTAPAIVLGAHYDTEYHPKGFVGANDAA
ncbi:MAG: glutaminyl-peptide cyclotransferase, partial [Baekduia sp.]|nr:glutaminyl-peptide cyclotransferase [Baekduia sp.]